VIGQSLIIKVWEDRPYGSKTNLKNTSKIPSPIFHANWDKKEEDPYWDKKEEHPYKSQKKKVPMNVLSALLKTQPHK